MAAPANSRSLGVAVRRYRKQHNLTQLEFSKLIHTTRGNVANIESLNRNTSERTIKRISKLLNATIVCTPDGWGIIDND
jgi:transcriptional regulator with XRE-family HTH domain